mmetsp:Transcript_5064/g.7757  ORF Transcript_5064/g.7757 Transcript_5064/m.7757 type:complete len:103 (-) Transcript_5064:66-374(-)
MMMTTLLDLCHQCLGHPSDEVLHQIIKVTEGIPRLPRELPGFHCPFCAMANLEKQPVNKQSTREAILPGSQFHMDCGFFTDPSTLNDIVKHINVKPKSTTKT